MKHAKWAVLPDVDMARRQSQIRLAGAERSARACRDIASDVCVHTSLRSWLLAFTGVVIQLRESRYELYVCYLDVFNARMHLCAFARVQALRAHRRFSRPATSTKE
eukprot:5776369-Pleurochrysis_carterae.AAC.1